jgi:phage shock protein E
MTPQTETQYIDVHIDVRTQDEYLDDHNDHAINLPLHELTDYSDIARTVLEKIPKDTSIKVFCLSGGRSAVAKQVLESLGYTDVENMGSFRNMTQR